MDLHSVLAKILLEYLLNHYFMGVVSESGTVVKGIVEYRSGLFAREDMPRKSLDIRSTDYPLIQERSMLLSLLPARMGSGRARL